MDLLLERQPISPQQLGAPMNGIPLSPIGNVRMSPESDQRNAPLRGNAARCLRAT